MTVRKLHDRDTEDFLRRVEEYDSKQLQGGSDGEQCDLLSKEHSDKEFYINDKIMRQRKPLNGKSDKQDRWSDDRAARIAESELVYKSAYNYERMFPSPRRDHLEPDFAERFASEERHGQQLNITKTYQVSEEDYLLLQRLKLGSTTSASPAQEIPTKVPSRGRPREEGRSRNHEGSILLLSNGFNQQKDRYREKEPQSPSLPARKDREQLLINNRESLHDDFAPSLPSRGRSTNIDQERREVVAENSNDESTPPLLPTRKPKLEVASKSKIEPVVTKSKIAPPPLPRKRQAFASANEGAQTFDVAPSTYLSSLEKNKLTDISPIVSKPKPGVLHQSHADITSNHLDYLDSVQKKSSSSAKASPTKVGHPLIIGEIDSQPDNFIHSALRTMGSDDIPKSFKSKPTPPQKPSSLKERKLRKEPVEEKDKTEFSNIRLRTVAKVRPQVPAKKNELMVPKLRSSTSPSAAIGDSLTKSTKKPVSNPEPLVSLKRTPPNHEENEQELPEALARLKKLSKSKNAPPVPSRKISMPEALKKAENLRKHAEQSELTVQDDNENEENFQRKLNEKLAVQNSRQPMTLRKPPTATFNIQKSETSELSHINKTRTKGPKRKLPSKVY